MVQEEPTTSKLLMTKVLLQLSYPAYLETGGDANVTVNTTAPVSTVFDTDVTLTIEAVALGAADTNYVLQLFTVLRTPTLQLKEENHLS